MSDKKIKIITLSDHPLIPSGVGIQTKNFIQAMLATGKYEVISLAGAQKHADMRPVVTQEWGQSWRIYPVKDYGTKELVREFLNKEKPDIMWVMTDPRLWVWLWEMEDEIRSNVPIVYYHVWDNFPAPQFNRKYYLSNDYIVTMSKVSRDIVNEVAPEVPHEYIPLSVSHDVFKKNTLSAKEFKKNNFGTDDCFLFFWNNRNARRKQSATLIWWFKEFLDQLPEGKDARLVMHTNPYDMYGPNLHAVVAASGIGFDKIAFSTERLPEEQLAVFYNAADCTINISDAEGFGLGTSESMACETPIIVNMTGGLQEQVTDGEEWFGIGIQPASKCVVGSQDVPYIYEDRPSKEEFIAAMNKMMNMSAEEREELGRKGRKHLEDNFSFTKLMERWDQVLTKVHNDFGSWDTRKGYTPYEVIDL